MGERSPITFLLHVVIFLILISYDTYSLPTSLFNNSTSLTAVSKASMSIYGTIQMLANQTPQSSQEKHSSPRFQTPIDNRSPRALRSPTSSSPTATLLSRHKHHHLLSSRSSDSMDYTIDLLPQPAIAAAAQVKVEAQILPWFLREGPTGEGGCLDRQVTARAVRSALKAHPPPAGVSFIVHLPPAGKHLPPAGKHIQSASKHLLSAGKHLPLAGKN